MSEPIKSVEEFIEWTKQLDGQFLLFRGLADADWKVESSAHRRIKASEEKQLPVTFQNYIKRLLDNAGLQGFRYQHGRKLSDLELLAELQHYGAATCLIDFTENALVALWFACQEEPEKDGTKKNGKVVAMATGGIETFSTVSYEDLNEKPIEEFLNPGKLWKWTPSSQNNRIVAQQSVFVFGEELMYDLLYGYEIIQIDAGRKKDILVALEKSFGVKEKHLFNDLAGFALHNAHDKKYDYYTAEDNFRLGLRFQQLGQHEKAKNYYDKALRLNPKYADAYNNRGNAKNDLGKHQEAIADFDTALELNPQHHLAYYNRGNAKRALGKHQEAIVDFDTALELNPKYADAYNNRGVVKNDLGNHREAIADFDTALELNPQHHLAYNNRGDAKLALGGHQSAIADFDKAIELNPKYAEAYNNRGIAKSALGDQTGAREDFARAREIDPNLYPPGS